MGILRNKKMTNQIHQEKVMNSIYLDTRFRITIILINKNEQKITNGS